MGRPGEDWGGIVGLALACEQVDPFGEVEVRFGAIVEVLRSMEAARMTESDLERRLDEEGRELLRQLLEAHLRMRSPGEAEGPVADAAGVERTETRAHQRQLVTSFGKIDLTRTGYAEPGRESLHPLDGDLNLARESYSLELRRKVAWEAARGSFEEAQEAVKRQTGVRIPKRQVEELTARAAADFQGFHLAREEEVEAPAPQQTESAPELPLLILSFDGKGIVVRKQDLRESTKRRRARGDKGAKKPGRKRMAIVATVYDVAPYVRTPLQVADGLFPTDDSTAHFRLQRKRRDELKQNRRPRPAAKRVWASLERDPSQVMVEAFAEAAARDPERRRQWIVLVDGEQHQLRLLRRYRKKYDFRIVLDFYHVLERLWAAAHELHPEDAWQRTGYVRGRVLKILSGWASQAASGMRAAATRRELADDDRKAVDDACDYLLKYQEYLPYGECLEAGLPIGTGVVEGTCRSLIIHRMDRSGARWSLAGAEAVLKLRALVQSGDFDDYWKFHEAAEQRRNHADLYADGQIPETRKTGFTRDKPDLKIVKSPRRTG